MRFVRSERSVLRLPHGELQLPVFLPDATLGNVRSVDSLDLERCEIQAVVMNVFHLMQRPGSSTIQAMGGLHATFGWQRPIVTDSGGFQAYSLIRQNVRYGQITAQGITFRPDGSDRKLNLTPEKCVQLQLSYGADVVICLDDCTHADDPSETQVESVKRTIDWARRGKREFARIVDQRRLAADRRPLLFAVIQGGGLPELRKRCAQELLEIGFDGFGFGGWPLDSKGNLLLDIISYSRELVPSIFPMHALGVGHPANVVASARLGYDLFDSSMPTRDARHGRLYAFRSGTDDALVDRDERWFAYVYIGDDKHTKSARPISDVCDCLTCANYSLAYLHHLFKVEDGLFRRLATIHNLRFMSQLTERLRSER